MKNLFILLMIVTAFGCGGDDYLKETPTTTIDPPTGNEQMSDLERFYKEKTHDLKIKDTTNVSKVFYPTVVDSVSYLPLLRGKNLWIGVFDEDKNQISELAWKTEFPVTKSIYKGYGDYEEYRLENIRVDDLHEEYLVLNVQYLNDDIGYKGFDMVSFYANLDSYIMDSELNIIDWFDNSKFVYTGYSDAKGVCFSIKGDSITEGVLRRASDFMIPFSYSRYIVVEHGGLGGIRIRERDIHDINKNEVKENLKINRENDYKFDVSDINVGEHTVSMMINVVEYSGDKHSHKVEVEISE